MNTNKAAVTVKSISEDQIRRLRTEAAEAGDIAQVAICDLALDGGPLDVDDYTAIDLTEWRRLGLGAMARDEALQACVDAINEGQS